ncbi:T9SS type A sorting domain-containing protein [Perlabentimonas gracilis]|uniref:T9SS type A sorting domain-containing protein n=1 Tax=Perlabentimonas gracilis TaxID=2715279 RepID=UPI0014081C5D|nr:T9SS type A sorting domain-containing protein [Perlabentimonas gracilis]NHB68069.1 T9SS type A sorting domain-containing protein [Perlabentimonas gracilis]
MKTIIKSIYLISTILIVANNVLLAQTNKTVGSGGSYETLNAAVADIRDGVLTGDIILSITSDITETATTYIRKSGSASWNYSSITIRPSGDARKVNAGIAGAILFIEGSNNGIVIDGRVDGTGSSNQLTFSNSSGPAITIDNYYGVENVTLKYLNLEGIVASATEGIVNILSHAASATEGIVLENCKIGNPNDFATNGIFAKAFSSGNVEVTLQNCEIANVWHPEHSSKGISVNEGCEGWTITSNSIYQTSSRTATAANTHYGIYINAGNDHNILNNYIGGTEPQCGGTAWIINGDYANKFVGIYLNVGTTTPARVNGNTISNFSHTYHSTTNAIALPGIWSGIYHNGGNANIGTITGNTIGTSTGTDNIVVNSTAASNVATFGIGINSAGSTVNVKNNHIGGFTLNATSATNGHSFAGIQTSAATNITMDNNTIGSEADENSIIATNPNESDTHEQNVRGIENTANASTIISNNTIANLSNSCIRKGDVVGIFSNNGVNKIVDNNISKLANSSGYNQYNIYNVTAGISLASNLDEQLVNRNTIHNLSNYYSGGTQTIISGILFREGSGVVSQNVVFDISFATDFYGIGNGIWLLSPSDATVMNNAIRLGVGESRNNSFVGIQSYGNNTILGNSVYIGGTATNDFKATYAYRKDYSGTDKVYNNIFYNARVSQTGNSENYAMGKSTGSGIESDFNNLYSLNPNAVASTNVNDNYLPMGSSSLEQWQTATGGDANSLSVDPQFVGAEDAIPDLHISASSPMINMGTSIYPLVVDIDDDIRNQLPDIGCDEFYTGSVFVGEGQTYTTLKQAFDAINAGTITGNISINIQSSTTETATATLYQSGYNGTSDYTSVSIGTVSEDITISGNIAAPIVSFSGVNNVNMVDLTIENENSDGYCIQFTNSASNNRIAGCNLVGNTQLSDKGLITFDVAGSGTGNSNNTIESCTFGNGISNYQYGVVSAGTAGVGNNYNTITESKISNFWSNANSSAGIYLDENNANWNITDNHLYQTEAIMATGGNEHFGILSLSSNNINISNNYIGGTSQECGGTAWTVSGAYANSFTGISISGENTDESTVSVNTISNFSWTVAPEADMYEGTGVWTAIAYGGGILTIADNTIGATTGTDNIVVETTSNYHVASYGIKGGIDGAKVTISDNTIGSIDISTSSVDYSHIFVGIQNDGATDITISNNLIGSQSTAKSINASTECTHIATGQHVAGIVNNANTTNCTITENIVKNLYNSTVSGWSSYSGSPFGHAVLGIAVTDGVNSITNNIISTLQTSSTDVRTEVIRGISVVSDKARQEVSNNTISGLSTTNNTADSKLIGIGYDGPLSGNNVISCNRIYNITSAEYTGYPSTIKGISLEDGISTQIVNNVVSLGLSETAGHEIIGIYTSKNGNFYHNSVNIGGDVSGSLNGNTYAFRINQNVSTAVVKNNIFVNTRTNSGTGKNYAALCQGDIELDYNAYWVSGTGTVLGNDGTEDIAELPIVAGQDENSVHAEVTFSSPNNGNLSTATAAVNASADASVGVTSDFEGNTRNPLYPDMGAYEFTQPVIINPGANLYFGWSDVLTPTAPQSYQIVGIDLSNNLVVTAPENFEVSLSSDEGFARSISVPRTNTNVDATIYARFLPDEVGYHFGQITNSASGQEVTVYVEGSARAIPPIVETGLASDITTVTTTANAEIVHTGGQNVTRRGIIYWAYDGLDKEIGGAGVSNEQETGSFGAEEYSIDIAELDINTHYNYRAHAYNAETGYGETADFWTLASIPNAPEITNITTSTLDITFENNSNPEITQFAIHETTTNRYIQPDGSMNTTPAWQTKSEWGTTAVTLYDVNNRTGNRNYNFEIKARNGAEIETSYGDATNITTLANTPNPTYLHSPTETSFRLSVYSNAQDYSNNTTNTLYAIKENNLGKYVQTNGTLGDLIEWSTRDNWAITLTGLSPATEYSFSTIAKNDDGIETEYSTPATQYTNAAIPNTPLASILDEAQLEVGIAADDNPADVEYCIKIGAYSNNHYVGTDGAIIYGPAWQTSAEWESTLVTAIAPNTAFYLTTKARNGAGVVTDASAQVDGTTTAKAPPAPNLYLPGSGVDKFTLWVVYLGSNPSNTELAIQDEISGQFVQPNGTFTDTPAWQTKASWDQTEVQAEAATQYSIRVKARNANDIETAFGEPSEVWTNPYAPGITLSNNTNISIDADIDTKGNPSAVEYALKTLNSNKWVQTDGTLGDESFWQSIEDWGSITITGLSPDTEYGVVAYARANEEQSVYSWDEQAKARTHANTPGAPTFTDISQTSLNVSIDANSNPASVRYAIYETLTGKYVGYSGILNDDPTWHSIEFSNSIAVNNISAVTEYTFKAKARNSENIETDYGPEASVTTIDGPPVSPTLINPANNSTDNSTTIVFEWEEISNAESYSIQISRNSYALDLIYEEDGIGNSSVEISNLPNGTTLYWRVNATNQSGTSAWSSFWSFSTEPGPPEAPELIYPDNGGGNLQPTEWFQFSWSRPNHTDGFTIQISKEPDFSSFELDFTYNLSSWNDPHYFYFDNISHNTTYYWRVKAWNEYGDSQWSDEYSFTTKDVTPDIPILISPVNNQTDIETYYVELEWNWSDHADWFEIQVATNSDFSSPIVDLQNHTQVYYPIDGLNENTTYFWKVQAVNPWAKSSWTQTWNFTTVGGTGVPTYSENDVTVYPNPATEIIKINGIDGKFRVEVISELGVKLIDQEVVNSKVNVGNLTPGVYIIKIETIKGIVTKQFIKQ